MDNSLANARQLLRFFNLAPFSLDVCSNSQIAKCTEGFIRILRKDVRVQKHTRAGYRLDVARARAEHARRDLVWIEAAYDVVAAAASPEDDAHYRAIAKAAWEAGKIAA